MKNPEYIGFEDHGDLCYPSSGGESGIRGPLAFQKMFGKRILRTVVPAIMVADVREWTLPVLRHSIVLGVLMRTMDAFKQHDLIYAMIAGGPGTVIRNVDILIYNMALQCSNVPKGVAGPDACAAELIVSGMDDAVVF